MDIPCRQAAVQLTGPDQLRLTQSKPVQRPGRRQYLVEVEAVGLCFSDMKLLAQFSGHARKSPVLSGVSQEVLEALPSYAPGTLPTVPGHEVCCRVVEAGPETIHYRPGERFIVQADYRPLKTEASNGAFGYNFEGGLQQFVLLDERITGDPSEDSAFMIPVPQGVSASGMALVEPWACVENSYASPERQGLDLSAEILVVSCGDQTFDLPDGMPQARWPHVSAKDGSLDDVILLAPTPEAVERCQGLLAKRGRLIILQGGSRLGRNIQLDVGRLHYMGQRVVGTPGSSLADALDMIPAAVELGMHDRTLIIGAGGPMGQMHVIRTLASCQGEVVATDTCCERLAGLRTKLGAWKGRWKVCLNTELNNKDLFNMVALMAPIPSLVQEAVDQCLHSAKVNIFAGIPVGAMAELDIDKVIEDRIFLYGTSGSEPQDMRVVLGQALSGSLDTNLSVSAVSGMAGAIEGLHAVKERTFDGKIVVYPSLKDLPLIPLEAMEQWYPSVATKLKDGQWTLEAEVELLRSAE